MAERRHPDWIKVRAPLSPEYFRTRSILQELKLHSVCQEACCPNIGECFSHRTATFMLMGDVCTRNCPYCAVAHGKVRPLDSDEPRRIAEAESKLSGEPPGDTAFRAAALAAMDAVDAMEDATTTAEFRRDLVLAVTRRALERAAA